MYFIWASGNDFTEELIASIEGTDDSDFKIMSLFEIGKQLAQRWGHLTPEEAHTMAREVGGNVVEKYQEDYGAYFGAVVGIVVALLVIIVIASCCLCCCCVVAACGVCSCCARSVRYKYKDGHSEAEAEFRRYSKED